MQALSRQQATLARDLLEQAYRLEPRNRDVRFWLANALRLEGHAFDSERMFRGLVADFPEDVDTAFALAFHLRAQGQSDQVARVLLDLAERRQGDMDTLLKAAGFLRDTNCFEEAAAVMRLALRLRPDEATLYFKLARLLQALGQFDEALTHLRTALERDPGLGGAWLSLAQLQQFTDPQSPDWQRITLASQHPRGEEADMCLAFARGKGLDDLGQWSEAWSEYLRGNRLRHAAQPWDRQAWDRFLGGALEPELAGAPAPLTAERHPVFIVGMLRSGTTLLEQLLGRHPCISGRGELNFLGHIAGKFAGHQGLSTTERKAAGDEFWAHMRLDGPAEHYYIDKNPLNFRYIGTLLDIMPEARILHLERDGRDSCLSCFFQLFQHPDAGFSNDLADLVVYYRGYKRLMAQFVKLAGDRIRAVNYSDLVQSPHQTIDEVLEFLGLEQDARMDSITPGERAVRTASAWQARQQVHQRSLARWKNYHAVAPDFFDALARIDAGEY
jgi:tetratricopeptide (TPR) repeat protein